jgi:zinc transport system substrate-binding protein
VLLQPLGHSSTGWITIEWSWIPLYRYLSAGDRLFGMWRATLFAILPLSLLFSRATGDVEPLYASLVSQEERVAAPAQMPIVLVSIPPLKYFVTQLLGNSVEIQSVVPSSANPHIFEPTPRQLARLTDAVLWFRIGESFERKVAGALEHAASDLTEINLLEGLDLIRATDCVHCDAHTVDPHVWLSAREGQTIASHMAIALTDKFPGQAALIQDNLQKLLTSLRALDQRLARQLASHRGHAILVSHGAFAYFCRDYGLKQLSIEQAGREPSPRQLMGVMEEAREMQTDVAILQAQFNNKGTELVAKKLGLRTCTINPLDEDVPGTLTQLAECITG